MLEMIQGGIVTSQSGKEVALMQTNAMSESLQDGVENDIKMMLSCKEF